MLFDDLAPLHTFQGYLSLSFVQETALVRTVGKEKEH